jgi:HPt (histidine-containing phosphotransfer) domain-containing protein
MDAYVSKPINEKELLSNILLLVNKKTQKDTSKKICDLDYLKSHGPNNPKFVTEMLQLILTQTPLVMSELKKCSAASDWEGLHGNAHKIKPTLDLIGLPKEIRIIAKQIEESASEKMDLDLIPAKLALLESNLAQAYHELNKELEKELKKIKT